jgi:hypothetical protein
MGRHQPSRSVTCPEFPRFREPALNDAARAIDGNDDGSLEGARQGYRTIRAELVELVPPHAVDASFVQTEFL